MADAAAEEGPTVQPLEVRYDPITGENTSQSPEYASDSVHPSGLMVLTASPSFPLDLLSKMLAFMGEMDGSSADVAAQPSPHTLPAAAATTEQPTESMPVHVALQHMMLSWFQSARSALCHPDVRLLPGAFPIRDVAHPVFDAHPGAGVPSEFNEYLPKESEEFKRWKASQEAGVSGAMEGLTVGEGGAAAEAGGGAAAAAAAAAPAPEKKGGKKKKGGKPEVGAPGGVGQRLCRRSRPL